MALHVGESEPWRAREYRSLLDIIHRRGLAGQDRYSALMNKEQRVLDTVDRVVNDARLAQARQGSFLDMSLLQVVGRMGEVLREAWTEVIAARSPRAVLAVFTPPGRRVYFGAALVLAALFLAVFHVTSSQPRSLALAHYTQS